MTYYFSHQPGTAPPWMQGKYGRRLLGVLGLVKDAFVEATKRAVKARYIDYAPADALDAVGENYNLDRAFISDDSVFKAMLRRAWEIWGKGGTDQSILDALATVGLTNVQIVHDWDWSADEFSGTRWWRFWVIVHRPHPFGPPPPWGSAPPWGDPSWHWGVGAGGERLQTMQRLIRKWKPTHAYCVEVLIPMGSGHLWGDGTWTWGDGTVTWGEANVAHIQV